MKTIVASCFLALIFFSQHAWAENDSSRCNERIVNAAGKHFGLDDFSGQKHVVAAVCKPWPEEQKWMIAAFAYDAGIEYEKTLLLSIMEESGNRIIAAYRGLIQEDAADEVHGDSLRLDTGRYKLSESVRAFGIRARTFQDRCYYEAGGDDKLTLFIREGNALRPVFSENMHYWKFDGPRCHMDPGKAIDDDNVKRTDVRITISVEPTSSNGFADLRLSAKRDDNRKPIGVIVKYNGENYDLKAWKDTFDRWWWQ
ncbi:MAG: hypothetical protein LBQ81_02870 [Zoogloeaceae bacterium]|jgi:hypothetical protein|nr:hypothetical protein [Zoogloeaceae bacterium]